MASPTEEELDAWMARLAEGDRTAFRPLFLELQKRALRLARRTLPEDQAMDAAQTILTKVFARASDFEPRRAALPWFYAIASYELRTIERRRRVARSRRADADAALASSAASGNTPEEALVEAELRGSLARAVEALDGPQAEAIAALLHETPPNVPPVTFRKRLSRAVARLRILMREADAD